MAETSFTYAVDDEAMEWIRVRIVTVSGLITPFNVQYETTIDGHRLAVTRDDAAHGYPHRDILDPKDQLKTKRWLHGVTVKDAQALALDDLNQNWQVHRRAYVGAT